jgi:hypothetical protein
MADQSREQLRQAIIRRRLDRPDSPTLFGSITGRTLQDHLNLERDPAFARTVTAMDFTIGSVGAEMEIRDRQGQFQPVTNWPNPANWNAELIYHHLMSNVNDGELRRQEDIAQSEYKLSFYVNAPDVSHERYVKKIQALLAQRALHATVIYSGGIYLDLLPVTKQGTPVHKGSALIHNVHLLAEVHNLAELPRVGFAGDSKNDCDAFQAAIDLGGVALLPSNISREMHLWATNNLPEKRRHIAKAAYGAGVLEGMQRFGLLD